MSSGKIRCTVCKLLAIILHRIIRLSYIEHSSYSRKCTHMQYYICLLEDKQVVQKKCTTAA